MVQGNDLRAWRAPPACVLDHDRRSTGMLLTVRVNHDDDGMVLMVLLFRLVVRSSMHIISFLAVEI